MKPGLRIFAAIILILTFLLIASEIGEAAAGAPEWIVTLDNKVADLAFNMRSEARTTFAVKVTELGSIRGLALLVAIISAYLLYLKKYSEAGFILASAIGAGLISSVTKSIFLRSRPDTYPMLADVVTTSFPSGHSLGAVAVFLALALLAHRRIKQRSPKYGAVVLCLLIPLVVAASRVYLGVHYLSDVIAGALAGTAWVIICWELSTVS